MVFYSPHSSLVSYVALGFALLGIWFSLAGYKRLGIAPNKKISRGGTLFFTSFSFLCLLDLYRRQFVHEETFNEIAPLVGGHIFALIVTYLGLVEAPEGKAATMIAVLGMMGMAVSAVMMIAA